MEKCALCKTAETQLYEGDVPICFQCSTKRAESNSVHSTLTHSLANATTRSDFASAEFESASNELTAAREEMIKAHNRLDKFNDNGIVPEDLETISQHGTFRAPSSLK